MHENTVPISSTNKMFCVILNSDCSMDQFAK